MKKNKNKFDKYFLLNWKKVLLIFAGFLVAVILHNLVYGLGIYLFGENFWGVGGDEPFFFIIAVILIPIYFLACFIYTLIKMIKNKSIFERNFLIRVVLALTAGFLISWFFVEFTFINPMGFYSLFIIFAFVMYYLIKLINVRFKN